MKKQKLVKVGVVRDFTESEFTTWPIDCADIVIKIPKSAYEWIKQTEKEYSAVQHYLETWYEANKEKKK